VQANLEDALDNFGNKHTAVWTGNEKRISTPPMFDDLLLI
jgi:hypothetical protein